MSGPAQDSIPRLAPGCRLSPSGGTEDLLLIPEGALRLKGPARSIVELCNGQRTVRDIVEELKRRHPLEDAARIEAETVALLTRLGDRGVLQAV
jgi:pyrroloquinoline quinone biosynthesis protein D